MARGGESWVASNGMSHLLGVPTSYGHVDPLSPSQGIGPGLEDDHGHVHVAKRQKGGK
jgi:hypothetical protein